MVGVFGVPLAREDDARRAVGAGLDIIRVMEAFTRPDGSPLQARVGVNTGRVLLHGDVSPESGESFLVGDAVNTAARLQTAAPPMGVVVGAETHMLTSNAFAFEELAPLTLKGKTARVKAWLVRGRALRTDAGTRVASPLVGRESELAACLAALGRLAEGSGALLLITGEAGIGKTRLVEELRGDAAACGCAWLEGRTLSFGRSISYWPFLEVVHQDAGIESDDDEQQRSAKLIARVSSLFGDESADVLPYLATLLSLPVPEELAERVRFTDGEAMGHQLYRAMRMYISRLATGNRSCSSSRTCTGWTSPPPPFWSTCSLSCSSCRCWSSASRELSWTRRWRVCGSSRGRTMPTTPGKWRFRAFLPMPA